MSPSKSWVPDFGAVVHIRGHRGVLAALSLGCGLSSAVILALAFPELAWQLPNQLTGALPWLLDREEALLPAFIGVLGGGALGLCSFVAAFRTMVAHRPVVTLGPDGFLDRRILREPVPWTEVTGIDLVQVQRHRCIALGLRGGGGSRLAKRLHQRVLGIGGTGRPADEFTFNSVGLELGRKELALQVAATAAKHGGQLAGASVQKAGLTRSQPATAGRKQAG